MLRSLLVALTLVATVVLIVQGRRRGHPLPLLWVQAVVTILSAVAVLVLAMLRHWGAFIHSVYLVSCGFATGALLLLFLGVWQHARTVGQAADSPSPDPSAGPLLQRAYEEFHDRYWQSMVVFVGAITLLGAWFAQDLAKDTNWQDKVGGGSFICQCLLGFVVAVALMGIWSAYLSVGLWAVNRLATGLDPLFRRFILDPQRLVYNYVCSASLDLLLFSICTAILYYYRPQAAQGSWTACPWYPLYWVAAVSFGFGIAIKSAARCTVLLGVVGLGPAGGSSGGG